MLASGCGVNVTVGPAHVSFGNGSKHRKHHVRYLAYNVRGKRAAHTHTHTHSAHRRSAQSVYAGRIVAVLDSSAPVFDQAASRASSTQGPDLADLCNQYGSEINILESQFEGVPHPYAWYSRAGWLHHTNAGVFHQMLGALQQCQTAVSNDDAAAVSAVVSDVQSAATQMRQSAGYARWLSSHG